MKPLILFIYMAFLSTVGLAENLPDDSIYQVGSSWVDQNNKSIEIEKLSGKIQIIAFVYTYCEHSCPIIMQRLKQIEKNISENKINQVQFTLFSLDPKRDTPEQLKAFALKHQLNEKRWSLYNGDSDNVLELANVVGVRYKPMNNGKDDIAHSNMITILDKQGRIAHQVKGFGEDSETVLNVIKKLSSDKK